MNKLLTLEEWGQLMLSIMLFSQLDYAWWMYPVCFLFPDVSMVGYLINTKAGARLYNLFYHKLLAIVVYGFGIWMDNSILLLAGIILFGHSAMDRVFGYGLKYPDDFKHTHLGWIGKKEPHR